MKTKNYNYSVFVADDNTEFTSEQDALNHNALLAKIKAIEFLLGGPQHQKVQDNKGYYQHSLDNIKSAWSHVIDLSRPYFKSYEKLMSAKPEEIHPMGFGGRIIDECSNKPLNKLWWRFSCIDQQGREWQQPYFALNAGKGSQIQTN